MLRAQHVIVADLSYGDAGKGSTVDWLCSPAAGGDRHTSTATSSRYESPFKAVIRFNGGAQAAHNVVTPDGRHHTFAQFGAGTLHGVPTFLSRFMMVEPFALAAEAVHLTSVGVPDPFDLLAIDGRALLTTPFHRAANRAREEARDHTPGSVRHGSCGLGIGETASYPLTVPPDEAPRVADCLNPSVLRRKLTALRDYLTADLDLVGITLDDKLPSVDLCVEAYEAFADRTRIVGEEYLPRLLASGPCVFEGAQGVLLDEWYGFHPHTTWSTTTFANAETLIVESGSGSGLEVGGGGADALRIGVVRTFTTRHGPGPMVSEDPALAMVVPEPHNGTGMWQGAFRYGHFDTVAHRYAVAVCGRVDALMVTHTDVAPPELKVCTAYQTTDEAGPLTSLVPSPAPDLGYQRALTKRLSAATPVLEDGPDDPKSWTDLIGAELGVRVAVTSHGPSWTQKAQVPKVLR